MTVEHVEVLVEEPSMEAALRVLLPQLLGEVSFEIYPHQSKQDLLGKLASRLHGYANRRAGDAWFRDHCRILIVVDRDDDDCHELKKRIDELAAAAGLSAKGPGRQLISRIAIEELEAWYFGDWQAVRAVYPKVSPYVPTHSRYRDPDAIGGGTWEAFERVLKSAGYFSGGLRKIEAARLIAAKMDATVNTSRSFQVFRDAVRELASA